MKAQVRLFALYRERAGTDVVEVSLPDGCTVADLLEQLQHQVPALSPNYRPTLVAVNSEYASPDQHLQEGDEIVLIPPVSGGSGMSAPVPGRGAKAQLSENHVRITYDPLDARELAQSVRRNTNGAVVTFEGVTRRFSEGKEVVSLEYDAYIPMAERKIAQIVEEIRQRWDDIQDVAVEHRIGHLAIGETSLVVAVAAPHRREAFAAAQYAVDRIKVEVPIWKKEVFTGGSGEWVGSEEEHAKGHRGTQ